jgi:hypothetical protein
LSGQDGAFRKEMAQINPSDFWGAGIQFPATQRGARRAREFFIPRSKPLEVCFFKPFEVE